MSGEKKDKWKGLKKQRNKVCIGIDNITEEEKHKKRFYLIINKQLN